MSPCYVRPIVLRGYGQVGVNPFNSPTEVYVANYEWGKYLGSADCEDGVDVCVSSWTRLAPNTMPTMAKAGANYMNSQLIKMEAIVNGYSEGIALDVNGYVSEGSGENIFVVHKDRLYTPPLGNSVLPGITRNSVLHIAQELGIPVIEQIIPREMLYIADELFFSGTAAEITPIRSVDKITVGHGICWPRHQDRSQGVLCDRERDHRRPLRLVDAGSSEAACKRVGETNLCIKKGRNRCALLYYRSRNLADAPPLITSAGSTQDRSSGCVSASVPGPGHVGPG